MVVGMDLWQKKKALGAPLIPMVRRALSLFVEYQKNENNQVCYTWVISETVGLFEIKPC